MNQTTVLPRRRRPDRLAPSERFARQAVAVIVAGFGLYGFATGAPSTVAYLLTVLVVAAVAVAFWDDAAPHWLYGALPVLVAAHLAGGLVRVGDDVLYNASFAAPEIRYDHLVHASGIFLGTVVLWSLFIRPAWELTRRRSLITMCVLAGLGLGALNETVEFLTTVVHHGAHVGGYTNTGWDLVCNAIGGAAAGSYLARSKR